MRIMVQLAYMWLNIRYNDIFFYSYFKYFIDDLENIGIDCLNEYDNCTKQDIESCKDTKF